MPVRTEARPVALKTSQLHERGGRRPLIGRPTGLAPGFSTGRPLAPEGKATFTPRCSPVEGKVGPTGVRCVKHHPVRGERSSPVTNDERGQVSCSVEEMAAQSRLVELVDCTSSCRRHFPDRRPGSGINPVDHSRCRDRIGKLVRYPRTLEGPAPARVITFVALATYT
jgi:hypothetical protein